MAESTAVAEREKSEVAKFKDLLESEDVRNAIRNALPSHLTPERLARIAYTTVSQTPGLRECAARSICMAVVEAAQLGLEPSNVLGLAYIVPFENKNTKRKEAQLMLGYKGKMELARRSNQVSWVKAEVVHAEDRFEYSKGLRPVLIHEPYEGEGDSGPLTHAYAVAKIKGEDEPIFEVLTAKDVQKRRNASRGSKSKYSPWEQWPEAMWKKSAIHALATYLPLTPEIQHAFAQDEQRDYGYMQGETLLAGDGDEDYIDAEADVLDEVAEKAAEGSDTDGEQAELPE